MGLVPIQEMDRFMKYLLAGFDGVRVVGLEAQPVVPMSVSDADSGEADPWQIRVHALTMQMKADFPSFLLYLHVLESGPWKIHWDSMTYRVDGYPDALITLRLHTLSLDPEGG